MAFGLWNRVRENSTTTGTGPFAVTGAVSGYKSFGSRMSVGDTTFGTIVNGTEWVTGLLTYSASNQITVTTVFESSNADTAVTFSGGTKDIFIDLPAFTALSAADRARLAGASAQATVAFSSSDTVLPAHRGAYVSLSGTGTLSYTAAATLADGFEFEVGNDGTGIWTHDPNSTETFEGSTTFKMYPGERWRVRCDGTKLIVVDGLQSDVFLGNLTGSGVAQLDFTRFDTARFGSYEFIFEDIVAATTSNELRVRGSTDGGSTVITSASYFHARQVSTSGSSSTAAGSISDTSIPLTVSNDNSHNIFGRTLVHNNGSIVELNSHTGFDDNAGLITQVTCIGTLGTGSVNCLRFYMTTGNYTGTIRCYGRRK